MSEPLRGHTPATLASLLAQADRPCTTGCDKGWINNGAAVRAWESEHADALSAFDDERRRNRSATVRREEPALRSTQPAWSLPCDCDGSGYALTADGGALLGFLARHGFWPIPRGSSLDLGPSIRPCSDFGGDR